MSNRIKYILLALTAFAVLALLAWHYYIPLAPSAPSAGVSVNSSAPPAARKFWLPASPETYRIAQAAEVQPRIIEATIDPPDVHVGDVQKFQVIAYSPAGIESVAAVIEIDHGTTTVALAKTGERAAGELQLLPYRIADNGKVEILKKPSSLAELLPGATAQAEQGKAEVWEGQWTVRDTHNTVYHTTFAVKDREGWTNSVTIAWSDACSIPQSGDWSIFSSGNCTISSTDGVENGNATIVTYTLTLNAAFAFNTGQQVTVTSGSIAVGSGGSLVETNLWQLDADTDAYPGNGTQYAQSSAPGGSYRRRYNLQATIDCYDSNASAYPGQTAYFTTDRGDNSWDYSCDSVEERKYPQTLVSACTNCYVSTSTCLAAMPANGCGTHNATSCGGGSQETTYTQCVIAGAGCAANQYGRGNPRVVSLPLACR